MYRTMHLISKAQLTSAEVILRRFPNLTEAWAARPMACKEIEKRNGFSPGEVSKPTIWRVKIFCLLALGNEIINEVKKVLHKLK